MQQGFKFKNPHEKTGCGCGHSFTVLSAVDPFATLGVPRRFDVDLAAVEKTHRELSRALHPDRYVGAGGERAPRGAERRRSRSTRPGASCATPSGAPRRCSRWPASAVGEDGAATRPIRSS